MGTESGSSVAGDGQWALRINARIAEDASLSPEGMLAGFHEHEIDLDGIAVRLEFTTQPPTSVTQLGIQAGGLSSEATAKQLGERLRDGLLVCGVSLRMGIDCVDGASDTLDEALAMMNADADPNPMHATRSGLNVLRAPPDAHVAVVTFARRPQQIGVEDFAVKLGESVSTMHIFSERHRLALELYASSHFEGAPRSRLVSLVTTLEALATPRPRSDRVQHLIAELVEHVTCALPAEADTERLKAGLRSLKREGIKQACRALVAARLTDADAEWFGEMYDTRSRLLHDGTVSVERDLPGDVERLDALVSQVVLRSAGIAP